MSWMAVETRLGRMHVVVREGKVRRIVLPGHDVVPQLTEAGLERPSGRDMAVLERAAWQLQEYTDGRRRAFDLPIAPEGTDFQKAVWAALETIPYGETRSYADIAATIGKPGAARAVGQANGVNPLPLVVPCHRVIAADGGLGGYMGDWGDGAGLVMKRHLLDLEGST